MFGPTLWVTIPHHDIMHSQHTGLLNFHTLQQKLVKIMILMFKLNSGATKQLKLGFQRHWFCEGTSLFKPPNYHSFSPNFSPTVFPARQLYKLHSEFAPCHLRIFWSNVTHNFPFAQCNSFVPLS